MFGGFRKNIKNIRFYSCSYNRDKPILFGPMFSSFFFGSVFTFWLTVENRLTYHGLVKKIEELKSEIEDIKNIKK